MFNFTILNLFILIKTGSYKKKSFLFFSFFLQFPGNSSVVSEVETENQSLKEDLKRCELEARELNTQLDTMKLDYEQLVHDRDREISLVTGQLEQMKQDLDIVLEQRDQAKDDLMGCHKQLDLLQARVNEHEKKSSKLDLVKEKEVFFIFLPYSVL